ncbi:MAG: chemotaxis protein CheA, partial [Anaerocolumna sp.]|nr:chemotaxis protein CheA [Anaerocolumna sp.]
MDVSQYLQIFIEESKENLQRLNENLLKLESYPEDIQTLNEIFRVAHTLKGMAGTMGFVKMQKLTHNAENVLSEIRSGNLKVNAKMLDTLFQCLDALENYVEEIINTSGEGSEDYILLIQELENITVQKSNDSKEAVSATKAVDTSKDLQSSKSVEISNESVLELPESQELIKNKAISMGMEVFQIEIGLSPSCVLKSARAFVIFTELERLGEIVHCIPSAQDIEDENFESTFVLVFITKQSKQKLQEIILGVSEVESVEIKVFKQNELFEEEPVVKEELTTQPQGDAQGDNTNASQNGKQQVSSKTVRVNIDRLDTLMNLVSELIIVKTQLEGLNVSEQNAEGNYNDSVEYLERVTTSLHDAVMKVRMVPVELVFNRFPRLIRDISRKLGKDIDLVMSGEETELDRTVIDEIGDPLIHLLRNAADHGLETTEERITLGKPKKGTIKLQAYQDGNSVVIEVQDDGRGINVNKIKSKAIQKGTLTKEEAAAMTEQEIIELLFKPSFSMAAEITDLSGRGV